MVDNFVEFWACPYPDGPTTTEQPWQTQNSTKLSTTLPTSILIGCTYHHRTSVAVPKLDTVNPNSSNLHPYLLHISIMSDKNIFRDFMDVIKNSLILKSCASRYNVHSRSIKKLLDEDVSRQLSRTRQEKEPLRSCNLQAR